MFGITSAWSKFVCLSCPAEVVIGSEGSRLSRDLRDQLSLRLCTKCWNDRKEKEGA